MKDAVKSEWEVRPLGEVCKLINGRAYKKTELLDNGPYPVLRVGNFFTNNHWYYSDLELDEDKYCDDGDLLYAWSASFGPRIWTGGKVIYHYHIWKVVPSEMIDRDFLYYFFDWDKELIKKEQGAGTTMIHVSKGSMEARAIPIPPLEEQQRIVAVLDEAFEGLARARAHAEANLQNAREMFENFLAGKMASESNDWTTYSFGDSNVLKIVDGDRGENYPKKTDFLSEGHCLFLNTKNVRPDGFNFDETMFISKERDQLLRKGKLLPRDVLLTTRGTIGNVAIFDDAVPYEHIRINSGMLILRPNEDIIRAEFLFELLRSAVIKEQIEEHVSGAAQPQLPIRSLVKFKLPAPKSTEEQLEIVEQLKQLSDKVSDMLGGYETKLQDLSGLRQSLLQKAFAGELT